MKCYVKVVALFLSGVLMLGGCGTGKDSAGGQAQGGNVVGNNKGTVSVTVYAPQVLQPLESINAEGLDELVAEMSGYKKVDADSCNKKIARKDSIMETLYPLATELVKNSTVIEASAEKAFGKDVEVLFYDLVFNGSYGNLPANTMVDSLENDMTFADAGIQADAEIEVAACYVIKEVDTDATYIYNPAHIMMSVPKDEETSTVYVLLAAVEEDTKLKAPAVGGYTAEWRVSIMPEEYDDEIKVKDSLSNLWLQLTEYIAPQDRFTGEYKEKEFASDPGMFSSNTIFTVKFEEGSRPDVVLISPNGKVYTSSSENDWMFTLSEDATSITMDCYEVSDAPWTIRVYKKDTKTVNVTMWYK